MSTIFIRELTEGKTLDREEMVAVAGGLSIYLYLGAGYGMVGAKAGAKVETKTPDEFETLSPINAPDYADQPVWRNYVRPSVLSHPR